MRFKSDSSRSQLPVVKNVVAVFDTRRPFPLSGAPISQVPTYNEKVNEDGDEKYWRQIGEDEPEGNDAVEEADQVVQDTEDNDVQLQQEMPLLLRSTRPSVAKKQSKMYPGTSGKKYLRISYLYDPVTREQSEPTFEESGPRFYPYFQKDIEFVRVNTFGRTFGIRIEMYGVKSMEQMSIRLGLRGANYVRLISSTDDPWKSQFDFSTSDIYTKRPVSYLVNLDIRLYAYGIYIANAGEQIIFVVHLE